jgi:hypothetical protein
VAMARRLTRTHPVPSPFGPPRFACGPIRQSWRMVGQGRTHCVRPGPPKAEARAQPRLHVCDAKQNRSPHCGRYMEAAGGLRGARSGPRPRPDPSTRPNEHR